jgi:serine O-acetyltransferase
MQICYTDLPYYEKGVLLMFSGLRETIQAYKTRDPAAKSGVEVFLLYPGIQAYISHKLAHWLYKKNRFFLARAVSQWSRFCTGIEIHPGATIGRRFVIDHGTGIIIGETTEIGDDVLLYQGVTLGGTGKDTGKRHPTIGNNVLIGAGAKVLGPFKVGDNARIAAGAVVLREIPPESTAVGVPARVVRIAGQKPDYASELDQISYTDPVAVEMSALRGQLEALEAKLNEMSRDSGGL